MAETARIALLLLTVLVSAAIYFLPALVAVARNVQVNRAFGVFILNLFLGWTLIGWVAALVWAVVEPAAQSKEGFRDAWRTGLFRRRLPTEHEETSE